VGNLQARHRPWCGVCGVHPAVASLHQWLMDENKSWDTPSWNWCGFSVRVCARVCVCRKYLVRTSKSKQITTVLSDGLMGNTMISSTFLLANDPVKIPKSNQFIRILCHVFFLHPWYMYVIVCVCVFFLAYIKPLDTKNTSYLETPWKPHFPTPSKGTAPFPVIPSRCGSWK